jgi:hypothetical protein
VRKQRTLFWGKSPAKSPKKNGDNRPVPERRFTPVRVADLEINFSNTTATQFGGYPLWAAFCEEVGFDAWFAQHIKMDRGANGFTAPELSGFFLDAAVLGAGRLVDVDRMRQDPMLVHAHGLETLASDETLGRYFKAYEEGHLRSLDRMNTRLNTSQWKVACRGGYRAIAEGKVILDYDSMTSTVYGEQEGADRGRCFRKKDKPGFQTKFAFIGGLGLLVNQQLCPQSYNLPKDFEPFHEATLAKLPKGARVWAIRGDGALYAEHRIERFEKKGYVYAISASRTADLRDEMITLPPDAWEEGTDEKGRPYSVARITYRPVTWKKARTYVVSRRLKDLRGQSVLWDWEKYEYFAYVTNYRAPLVAQWQFCVERCSMENFIKEGKLGFRFDTFPCREQTANLAYLGHLQMAYNAILWWKLFRTPAGVNRWTIATLRERVFNVCGNLVKQAGRWVLSLPAWWPWRTVYEQLARQAGLAYG